VVWQGGPLIRIKPKDLASVGVRRVGRVAGIRDGMPVLEGDQLVQPASVVWCTGYHPGLSWIDLPVFGPGGEPVQERGIAAGEPGLRVADAIAAHARRSAHPNGRGSAH
jgi:putative flavoprotein involved in K+ transport